ncbi:hypothetical protein MDAP_001668 [Mitosporidium daphniae]
MASSSPASFISTRLKEEFQGLNSSDGPLSGEEDYEWDELDALGELATLSESHRQSIINTEISKEDDLETDPVPVCQWNLCGIQLSDLKELVTHISEDHVQRSTGAKADVTPWACEWEGCPRKSIPHSSRNALISHMRGHTGEKPFSCPKCPKRFPRADAMQKHIRNHHQQPLPLPSTSTSKSGSKKSATKKNFADSSSKAPASSSPLAPMDPISVSYPASNDAVSSISFEAPSSSIPSELSPQKLQEIGTWLESVFDGMPLFTVRANHETAEGQFDEKDGDCASNGRNLSLLQVSYNSEDINDLDKRLLAQYYVSMQERHFLLFELQQMHAKATTLAAQITECRGALDRWGKQNAHLSSP